MMTTDEMITVLQAYKEGKKIEVKYKYSNGVWQTVEGGDFNVWDFYSYDYRVKPEPHYRPFKNAKEVIEAIKEHGNWVKYEDIAHHMNIAEFNDKNMWFGAEPNNPSSFENQFNDGLRFIDGTPFGKPVEE